MPRATATSEPGTAGATRRSPSTSTSVPRPTASVRASAEPRSPRKPTSFSKKSPSLPSTPNIFGTCPTMIVSASPTMKPLSTGSEMKEARKPSRSRPASTAAAPTHSASAIVSCVNASVFALASSPTVAADSAAVAAIGPVTRCRELPSAA